MTLSEPIWLGSLAVFGACVLFVCKPTSVFGRALTFEEAASVCWVAHSIYIGTVAVYLALKFQFGISRAANAPATAIAACASVLIILYLGHLQTDWKSAVTKSIFGVLFVLLLVALSVIRI